MSITNEPTKGKRGGYRPGSGRKKSIKRTLQESIDSIDCERIFKQLDDWAKGKPVICPHCMKDTGLKTADTVALQSAIELLNRRLGKPVQKHEVDITENIILSADQIDILIERYQLANRAMLPEGLTKEDNGSNKGTEEGISEGIYEEA